MNKRGRCLLFKSQRAVLVEESLGVLKSALKLIFALVIQTTSGERTQRSVFYFQFLLLAPTLLEDGIQGWKDPIS
ncbi:L4 33K 14.6 kDa protein [Human adenovirus 55]|uniref:L4 33K 14.6 kDa protein n=1 Tax=Human adenovirus 55 TaxID=714978 RepID=A0A7L9QZW2_9ADEN|nr:L4 33K 14.6 kDa protein [Human adenovirus 55]QOL08546.1 L4 33K 14.6 kDa protein [Human adenovirus 55]QOL08579.1 L4 33K 14.6 kDa protein [Human adenovirus 55]QOL08612.1 L4 33K 14.6 kDa protein [Human adenovirus 55]QOL08645.1 L4 33K 14.6 kDa protein [Human adenovirus 55]